MVNHNISPETLNCPCCPHAPRLPESGYRICQKREGLIPRTLRPLVEKRQKYKQKSKQEQDARKKQTYQRRQECHKWLLVTCFGYLGYKNARFGRIEAHESVTTIGREKLLRAKEIAEQHGYQFYHAIVDCIWIQKKDATEQDYERLALKISIATGIPMNVDGLYKWLGFLPSRDNLSASVANRYFGAFTTGEAKIRGLEQRRRDIPIFIKNFQAQMIQMLARADNLAEYLDQFPRILNETQAILDDLHQGRIPFDQLLVQKNLSRNPSEYKVKSHSAIAADQMLELGFDMQAGMRVSYLLTDTNSKNPNERVRAASAFHTDDGIDVAKYEQLLIRSVETLYNCFGYTEEKLNALLHTDTNGSRPL